MKCTIWFKLYLPVHKTRPRLPEMWANPIPLTITPLTWLSSDAVHQQAQHLPQWHTGFQKPKILSYPNLPHRHNSRIPQEEHEKILCLKNHILPQTSITETFSNETELGYLFIYLNQRAKKNKLIIISLENAQISQECWRITTQPNI